MPIPKLYNISGDDGQNIIEVPLRCSELNGTDSFLVDDGNYVNIWNAKPIQYPRKQQKAHALARYIIQNERVLAPGSSSNCSTFVQFGDESKENFGAFKKRFLKYLSESVELCDFPRDDFTIFNGDFQNKRLEQVRLFEYSYENYQSVIREVIERPLDLALFKKLKAYVMTDHYNGNVFIYIAEMAPYKLIEETMATAEAIYRNMFLEKRSGRHRKLTLILEGHQLPAHFIVNFPKEVENLGITKSKIKKSSIIVLYRKFSVYNT